MSDHLCFRDSLTTCMALLASTKTIKVAPAPMSPYSRTPIISAMSVATMDEFAPGRVIASPGTGNAAALKEAGIESPHPLQTMREYVEILRRLLKGDTVNFQGKMFQMNGAKMGFVPSAPIPMYITAVRSRMLQLGGEIGEGVLLSAGCAPGYIKKCTADIATGAAKANKSARRRGRCRIRHGFGFGRSARSDRSQQNVSRLYFSQRAPRRKYSPGRRHGRSRRARRRGGQARLGGGEEVYQRRSRLRSFRRGHAGRMPETTRSVHSAAG